MSSRKPVRGAAKRRKLEPRSDEQTGPNSATLESHLNLLNQGKFSDVTFIVGEGQEEVPCHKLFLKARSSVFEVMFNESCNQEIEKGLILPEVQPKAFKMFLQFLYADIFEATVPEALELLQLANKYDVQLLVSKCEEVLKSKVTLNNALRVFQAARNYENVELMDKAGDLLTKSLPELPTHPSFAHLDKETLMYVLKRKDLKMKEVDVFHLALQWARNQKDATVKESLEDILPLIRFPIMTRNEFTTATAVVPTDVLPQPTVNEIFKYFGSDDEAKTLLATTLGFSTKQRQQKETAVYVALYPGIIPEETRSWSDFKTSKESLQFCFQMPRPQVGSQQQVLGVGLSFIRLFCPANKPRKPHSRTVRRRFMYCLQSKHCRDRDFDFYSSTSYKTLVELRLCDIQEGKQTDLTLRNVIPLKTDTIYCITIEIITVPLGHLSGPSYDDTDPMETVDVNIESVGCTTLTVRRNQLQGFTKNSHAGPHLICGLGFRQL